MKQYNQELCISLIIIFNSTTVIFINRFDTVISNDANVAVADFNKGAIRLLQHFNPTLHSLQISINIFGVKTNLPEFDLSAC